MQIWSNLNTIETYFHVDWESCKYALLFRRWRSRTVAHNDWTSPSWWWKISCYSKSSFIGVDHSKSFCRYSNESEEATSTSTIVSMKCSSLSLLGYFKCVALDTRGSLSLFGSLRRKGILLTSIDRHGFPATVSPSSLPMAMVTPFDSSIYNLLHILLVSRRSETAFDWQERSFAAVHSAKLSDCERTILANLLVLRCKSSNSNKGLDPI